MKVEAGTEEHKEVFCRQFLDTHKPFTPEELDWPDLSQETIEKLKGFPIWDYAIFTAVSYTHLTLPTILLV